MNIGFEAKRIFHNKTGLGNYSRDLINILCQYFPDNNYFLYNSKKTRKQLFAANKNNVFEKNPTSNFLKKFHNLWRQYFICNDLHNDKVNIFHGLSGEIPFGLKSKKINAVVTIHDLIFVIYPELYSFFDRKIHYYKFKKSAKQAKIVVAISEQTKKDIVKYLKIDPSKIEVIYQGCNQVFKNDYSEIDCETVREKFNLPENFILNVGTIETRKNIFLAVKAIKSIDIKLVIVGKETAYSAEIKNYLKINNIVNKVIFLKSLSLHELAVVYKLSQIFVYPSIYEGFGIPIIEALFSKTPVITTNTGVFSEAAGPHSIYINPENVLEMENAIKILLENESLRNEISEKSFEFVQKFNDINIANAWIDVYNRLNN